MTEINQNYGQYGHNIENSKSVHFTKESEATAQELKSVAEEHIYAPDTGVLGRSQVKSPKGGNITKSVNEAVAMATEMPAVMFLSDEIFDEAYKVFLEDGMTEDEAYVAAMALTDRICEPAKI